jgi:hypothetical protein
MSLSLYGVPDGPTEKRQSASPCPSVYSPAPALGSLSSVALSSVQALGNLTQTRFQRPNYRQFSLQFSSGFLVEATNLIWSGFLREAICEICGGAPAWTIFGLPGVGRVKLRDGDENCEIFPSPFFNGHF